MDEENYQVTLRSYGEKGISEGDFYLSSTVKINCKHYETFCKIVDAVCPILREEHHNKRRRR